MLAKYQSTRLENLQKCCLRAIYGYEKTYTELLQESELKSLEERRDIAVLKFAKKNRLEIHSLRTGFHVMIIDRVEEAQNHTKNYMQEVIDCIEVLYTQ